MNISPELKNTALDEFDFIFGDLTREVVGEPRLYSYFSQEYLKGVSYGVRHHLASSEEFTIEANVRYSLNHGTNYENLKTTPPEIAEKILKSASYVFIYGANWGHNLVNGVGVCDN